MRESVSNIAPASAQNRESSKSDPANFGTITRHTFALHAAPKMHKCDNFRELFDPLPPSDQCWILCWWSNLCVWQHLSFQHFVHLSALENRNILHSNAHRLGKELQQNSAVCATTVAEFTQFLCAQRAENFGKFAIFSRELGAKFAWPRRWMFSFFGSE